MINWQQLLTELGVTNQIKGKNVGRDSIGIQCPFCGDDDPSMHMNIKFNSNYYFCWRNEQHRGKFPNKLISALCAFHNISIKNIEEFIKSHSDYTELSLSYKANNNTNCHLPEEFQKFEHLPENKKQNPYFWYLIERGFEITTTSNFNTFMNNFQLGYCRTGEQACRIIVPYFSSNNEMCSYTGRSIDPSEKIKYKTSHKDNSKIITSDTLYGIHLANNSRKNVIIICEGPFDVLKMENLCENAMGTTNPFLFLGTSTNKISESQLELICQLSEMKQTDSVYLFYDSDVSNSIKLGMKNKFESIGIEMKNIDIDEINDPGEMTKEKMNEFINKI